MSHDFLASVKFYFLSVNTRYFTDAMLKVLKALTIYIYKDDLHRNDRENLLSF